MAALPNAYTALLTPQKNGSGRTMMGPTAKTAEMWYLRCVNSEVWMYEQLGLMASMAEKPTVGFGVIGVSVSKRLRF